MNCAGTAGDPCAAHSQRSSPDSDVTAYQPFGGAKINSRGVSAPLRTCAGTSTATTQLL
jgi:hypothetical protein